MARRVRKHPERLTARLLRWLASIPMQQRGLRQVEIVYFEVHVRLLWRLLSWPLRCVVVRDPLKPEEKPIRASQTRKIVVRAVRVRKPCGRRVERCQSQRVGAVKRYRAQRHECRTGIHVATLRRLRY